MAQQNVDLMNPSVDEANPPHRFEWLLAQPRYSPIPQIATPPPWYTEYYTEESQQEQQVPVQEPPLQHQQQVPVQNPLQPLQPPHQEQRLQEPQHQQQEPRPVQHHDAHQRQPLQERAENIVSC
ncbi:unnamed protein product [Caenorhabditis brenneri]